MYVICKPLSFTSISFSVETRFTSLSQNGKEEHEECGNWAPKWLCMLLVACCALKLRNCCGYVFANYMLAQGAHMAKQQRRFQCRRKFETQASKSTVCTHPSRKKQRAPGSRPCTDSLRSSKSLQQYVMSANTFMAARALLWILRVLVQTRMRGGLRPCKHNKSQSCGSSG